MQLLLFDDVQEIPMAPSYSVVVPTHRRPDTLAATLQCLASVAHPRLEVVVFNNAGGDETVDVVTRHQGQSQLKLVNSDRHLPMQDSWEQGIAAASGDYITVIGDDDSLLSRTITMSDEILSKESADVV